MFPRVISIRPMRPCSAVGICDPILTCSYLKEENREIVVLKQLVAEAERGREHAEAIRVMDRVTVMDRVMGRVMDRVTVEEAIRVMDRVTVE